MTKWKYTGKERKSIHGHWVWPNGVLESKRRPTTDFVRVGAGEEPKKKSPVKTKVTGLRTELLNLHMDKLREIGYVFDAKDTKKSELVDEILEKAPNEEAIKKLMGGKE